MGSGKRTVLKPMGGVFAGPAAQDGRGSACAPCANSALESVRARSIVVACSSRVFGPRLADRELSPIDRELRERAKLGPVLSPLREGYSDLEEPGEPSAGERMT